MSPSLLDPNRLWQYQIGYEQRIIAGLQTMRWHEIGDRRPAHSNARILPYRFARPAELPAIFTNVMIAGEISELTMTELRKAIWGRMFGETGH
jgi:hypothetical protein